MTPNLRPLALALLAALALPALAQKAPAAATKKLYCWDQNGSRVCSDTLPQEAVGRARDEINSASGMRTAEVQRALTDEERAAQALEAAQQQAEAAAVETRRRTDQAMLMSYQSEDELRRVFAERSTLIDNNIRTSHFNVSSLREGLVGQLRSAGDQELGGRKVGDKLADSIRRQHAELIRQQRMQRVFEQQRATLNGEIDEALARYRALTTPGKAAAPAAGG